MHLEGLLSAIRPVDAGAAAEARARHERLTKPPGSLGVVEDLGVRLSAIARRVPPPIPRSPAIAVFAGDHGVLAEGVSRWPADVTGAMIANFCAGGAGINVLARQAGATLTVVDVGTLGAPAPSSLLQSRKIAAGTANLADGAAMSPADALDALLCGASVAAELAIGGADLLVGGEMGIGNTTPATALIAALTGAPIPPLVGRGAGLDDAGLAVKQAVITQACARLRPGAPPLEILAEVGGFEHAALAGFYLGAARAGLPVIVDGVIALSGALVASALCPALGGYLIAGHRSAEPATDTALGALGLRPLLDLGMRLGEGSGAALAIPIVRAAAAILGEMATFDEAGISSAENG